MKKSAWGAIGTICLVVVGAFPSCCARNVPQEPTEAGGTETECKPIETSKIIINVDSKIQPIIPFIKVPYTHGKRLVTFATEGGQATVVIPVAGTVDAEDPTPVKGFPGCVSFNIDDQHSAILEISQENKVVIEVEYQVLCNENGNLYWAKGQSPPRMQIPPPTGP